MATKQTQRIMNVAKKFANKLVKSDNVAFTFIRSSISSQISSWTDMAISFIMYAWIVNIAWLSTAIGAICGGIVNCIIGYNFTFHANGVSKKAVIIKFILVWIGSLTLNSAGTELLTKLLQSLAWIGLSDDACFAIARIIISLAVSIAWNFLLQRSFVFRPNKFDAYASRIFNIFQTHK